MFRFPTLTKCQIHICLTAKIRLTWQHMWLIRLCFYAYRNAHWSLRACRCFRPWYCVMNPCPWARVVFSTVRALIWILRSKYRAVGEKVHGFKISPVSVWNMTVVVTSRLNQSFILSSTFPSFCKICFLIVYCKIDWFLGDLSTLFQLKMLHGAEWDGTTIINDLGMRCWKEGAQLILRTSSTQNLPEQTDKNSKSSVRTDNRLAKIQYKISLEH
jgi:hypothetical protein